MNASAKRKLSSGAMALAIALIFGLFSWAQYSSRLHSLSTAQTPSFAIPHSQLARHSVLQVRPSKRELTVKSTFAAQSLAHIDTARVIVPSVGQHDETRPEAGRFHPRIPARSAEDPDPF